MKYFFETSLAELPNKWPRKYFYQKTECLLYLHLSSEKLILAFISSTFHCCLRTEGYKLLKCLQPFIIVSGEEICKNIEK